MTWIKWQLLVWNGWGYTLPRQVYLPPGVPPPQGYVQTGTTS